MIFMIGYKKVLSNMNKILSILNKFDLLYYACYIICRKNFPYKGAGSEMASALELLTTLPLIFFFMGIFSLNINRLYVENWKFYIIFVLIILVKLDNFLKKYHINRHDEVIAKYEHIKSIWKCLVIYSIYSLVVLTALIISGIFWYYRVHGYI